MADLTSALHRRSILVHFAQFGGVIVSSSLLGGCGSGEPNSTASPLQILTTAGSSVASVGSSATSANTDNERLNFVLNLSYLAAQFHVSATGGNVPSELLTGVGRRGTVIGARKASLLDPLIVSSANHIAAEKQEQLEVLRKQLGSAAAAMPAIDLTVTTSGNLARLTQSSGTTITTIDPFADDVQFLLGSFVVENALAATQRGLLAAMQSPAATSTLQASLAASIYHGGLINTLVARQSANDPTLAGRVSDLSSALAELDGSTGGDQNVTTARAGSSNLSDASGHPIPFTRTTDQALRLAFLGTATSGGFFPQGFNGFG